MTRITLRDLTKPDQPIIGETTTDDPVILQLLNVLPFSDCRGGEFGDDNSRGSVDMLYDAEPPDGRYVRISWGAEAQGDGDWGMADTVKLAEFIKHRPSLNRPGLMLDNVLNGYVALETALSDISDHARKVLHGQ